MRIRSEGRVPYYNKRDQYRMLMLVGGLCVIIFAITVAAKPRTWYWLTNMAQTEQASQKQKSPEATIEGTENDQEPHLKPGEFLAQASDPMPLNPQPIAPPQKEDEPITPVPAKELLRDLNLSEISPQVMQPVPEVGGEISPAESTAYWSILSLLQDTNYSKLQEAAESQFQYRDLIQVPQSYRGRLLHVRGELQVAYAIRGEDNQLGGRTLYDCLIELPGEEIQPVRVITLRVPSTVELGEKAQDDPRRVMVSGYYFRNIEETTSEGTKRVAPLLLAKEVESVNPPEKEVTANLENRLLQNGNISRIKPNALDQVQDKMGFITPDEGPAYWGIFALLERTPAEKLDRAAKQSVAYTALLDEPQIYRGELLQVEGELRLVSVLPSAPNEYKVGERYECWISTPGSGNKLLRAQVLNLPKGVEVKEYGTDPIMVEVTGYFFKNQGYQRTGGGSTLAPLLLGKALKLPTSTIPPVPVDQGGLAAIGLVFIGFLVLVMVGLVFFVQRRDRAFEKTHLHRMTAGSPEQTENLNQLSAQTPEEYIQSLEQPKEGKPATEKPEPEV